MKLSIINYPSSLNRFSKLFVDSIYYANCSAYGPPLPVGEYPIILDYDTEYNCETPRMLNTPNGLQFRIFFDDRCSDGTKRLAVGSAKTDSYLLNTKATFKELTDLIGSALDFGEDVTLEVRE